MTLTIEELRDLLRRDAHLLTEEGGRMTASTTLAEATGSAPDLPAESARPARAEAKVEVALPTERTVPSGDLLGKTILLYGPPKVGKSTLASEFGDVLFLDTEGGLNDLGVFRVPVGSWAEFLAACGAAVGSGRYPVLAIDTVDVLATQCSQEMCRRLGIVHESDLEWGKGWSVVRQEFSRAMFKLAASPPGLIMVSHSKDLEVKTRNKVFSKAVPTLTGQLREIVLNMADLILFLDFDGEDRVIWTKPSENFEAGERGRRPRLPARLPWPVGESGAEVVRRAWGEGGEGA